MSQPSDPQVVDFPLDPLGAAAFRAVASILQREYGIVSFWLKPFGFFERNPSLDVVGTPPDACHTSTMSAHH